MRNVFFEKKLRMSKKRHNFAPQNRRRKDAGVVDRDGLENRCTLTGTQGSNPCLSAIKATSQRLVAFFCRTQWMRTLRVRYRASTCEARIPVFPQKKLQVNVLWLYS